MFHKDAGKLRFDVPLEDSSMPTIRLFEDTACSDLYPFHRVEGVASIRHGAFTQAERWHAVSSRLKTGDDVEYEVLARWIPDDSTDALLAALRPGDSIQHDGLVLARARSSTEVPEGAVQDMPAEPRLLKHANQLFHELDVQLALDLPTLRERWALQPAVPAPTLSVYGPTDDVLVAEGAMVRAASIDTSTGPVILGPGAILEPGCHLAGPVLVHEGATVKVGASIRGATVIGPQCKVGGEVSNVHFQGWANKAHDGFLGNSVIGRWCNLGAGTTSSNLKNTYGEVRQWSESRGDLHPTGLQFCGLLMGDHSKCGIGTVFNTGTVVGPASVLFDVGFPPKHLPPFSWYDARQGRMAVQDLDRMLSTADTVMARRQVEMTPEAKANLTGLHAQRVSSSADA